MIYKKSLTFEIVFCSQVEINAYDLGSPRRDSADNAFVNIQIVRNNNSPFFIGSYSAVIDETEAVSNSILKIQVGDQDQVVGNILLYHRSLTFY